MCVHALSVHHSAKQKELTAKVLQSRVLILAHVNGMSVCNGMRETITVSSGRENFKTLAAHPITPSFGPIESRYLIPSLMV